MDIETFTQDIDWAANAVYDSHKYESKTLHGNYYLFLPAPPFFTKELQMSLHFSITRSQMEREETR